MEQAVRTYLRDVDATLKGGDATEHSYRPALKQLLESVTGLAAVNEPKQSECGAPDFVLRKDLLPIGYIECKDVGTNLNNVESGRKKDDDQMRRYLKTLPNLILTDYLEFRWYVNGEKKLTLRIANWNGSAQSPMVLALANCQCC